MHWIMTALMFAGFALASMSGMVCYMGVASAADHLSGLSMGQMCLTSPYICMGTGVTMLLIGFAGQPGRIQ